MGGASAGSNSGNDGADAFVNKKSKVKTVKRDKFGYEIKENPVKKFISGGGVIGAVTKPFRDATEEVNRKFYEEKVVPAGKSKAPNYETYMKDRLAGKTDAYGNPTPNQGGGNDNTPAPTIIKKTAGGQTVQTTAPTEAELSQSAAADAEEYDLRKTKKRGRSMMTLTSSKGVTDNKLTLGKPSLLGS